MALAVQGERRADATSARQRLMSCAYYASPSPWSLQKGAGRTLRGNKAGGCRRGSKCGASHKADSGNIPATETDQAGSKSVLIQPKKRRNRRRRRRRREQDAEGAV